MEDAAFYIEGRWRGTLLFYDLPNQKFIDHRLPNHVGGRVRH
jgi:hypothetical protein